MKDRFGNIIQPYRKWRKGRWPKCPHPGHHHCEKDEAKLHRSRTAERREWTKDQTE